MAHRRTQGRPWDGLARVGQASHTSASVSWSHATAGPTALHNLCPLCRRHHNAKTHGLWRLSYDPDTKTKTWTSPLGKTYTVGTDPPLTW